MDVVIGFNTGDLVWLGEYIQYPLATSVNTLLVT